MKRLLGDGAAGKSRCAVEQPGITTRAAILVLACILTLLHYETALADASAVEIHRLAFGSCLHQDGSHELLGKIAAGEPQVMVFLGDNIYAVTEDPSVLRAQYGRLGAQPLFRRLKSITDVLAVWDDNDYGMKDGGREYRIKNESREAFLKFFDHPDEAAVRMRHGIYSSRIYGPLGRRLQIILLDTRTFRDPLRRNPTPPPRQGPFLPHTAAGPTILGEEQWKWLAGELKRPAELRVVASSIQFVADTHGYETWGNFPHERMKLIKLLSGSGVGPVVIISGDRHHGEISRWPDEQHLLPFELYDVTSSSLNMDREPGEESNPTRLGPRITKSNFGLLRINWESERPSVRAELHTLNGPSEAALDLDLELAQPGRHAE